VELSALFRAVREGLCDEHGATATEYAVLLALVLTVILASVTIFGQSLGSEYTTIGSELFG